MIRLVFACVCVCACVRAYVCVCVRMCVCVLYERRLNSADCKPKATVPFLHELLDKMQRPVSIDIGVHERIFSKGKTRRGEGLSSLTM